MPPPLVLCSPALAGLPVVHGFTTRIGGVSPAPHDSLNFSRSVGDDAARVARNEEILCAHIGAPGRPIVTVNQVHGVSVLEVAGDAAGGGSHDALVTARDDLLIAVKTADCTPILLYDPVTGAIGAVHAGWRGTAARAPGHAVESMTRAFGSRPADLIAVIGPAAGACCYTVGNDVIEAFARSFGPGQFIGPGDAPRADLHGANRRTLLDAGLLPDRVHVIRLCTICNPALFYSHRRDRELTGRHLNFIGRK